MTRKKELQMTKVVYEISKKEESTGTDSINGSSSYMTSSNELIIEVEKPSVHPEKELTTFTKFCFAVAGMPYQMCFCIISIFITIFLLEKANMPAEKTTYILFISRIMDAITDPIYGYFVNITKVTKYGKMKPWIIVSTPLTVISYIMIWYVPSGWSEDALFWWFIVWNTLFFTFITGVRIPHTAMTMYLSKNQEDRQSATIYRMGFELIGILLALGIQGPFVIGDNDCIDPRNKTTNTTTTTEKTDVNIMRSNDSLLGDQTYVILAVVMSIFFLVGNILLIVFVKERNDIEIINNEKDETHKTPNTLVELKRMFTYKPFVILFIAFLFNQLTIQIIQANIQMYFEYGYYALKDFFVWAILILLALAIFSVPLWQFIMKKIGKKLSLIIGNIIILPLMIGCLFFHNLRLEEIIPFAIFIIIASNSFTASFLVPWAMLPECVDSFFLQFRSRPDALFYTFFVLGVKILFAFYVGLSQLVLSLVDFKNNVCAEYQNENVSDVIIYTFVPFPLLFSILSSIATFFYPINEAKAEENTKLINQIDDDKTNRVNSVLEDPTRGEILRI